METSSERINQFIDYKGLSVMAFEKEIGAGNNSIGTSIKRKSNLSGDILSKILNRFSELDANWVITGKEPMLKSDAMSMAQKVNQEDGIPLIPLDAMAGIASGEISIMELDCERYIIPMFRGADYLIPVKGSSMYPKYSSGDVVACRKIPLQDIFFQWNKVYVLDTNQGPIIKRIAKSEKEGYIKIVSENPKYEPFELNVEQIYAVSIVIGVVRLE